MIINHISVSRKKCYDTCAQQYKFRYHLKVPRPGEEPFYFTYGSVVHRIAEVYVQRNGEDNIGDIASDLLRGKIVYEVHDGKEIMCPISEMPEDYAKKFPKHLKAIKNLTDKIGTDGVTEHPFYYDLDAPNEKFAKGFLDRLIIKGEGADRKAFIIDYKTTKKGKWRVNKDTVKTDLQLRMYSRVVQREFDIKAENIKAALFYLEGENLIACQYSEQSLEDVEKDLHDSHIMIGEADADQVWGKVGWHCKFCDYRNMCPFYTPTSKAQDAFDGDMSKLGF
jgi:CRISPR/Cas system-associated exonuclease Cas4 (RecB family)